MRMFGRKKYVDDYDEMDENEDAGTFVPPQKVSWPDFVIAAALGVFAAVLSFCLSYRGLHPDAWSECAVAAGLRPPESLVPGFWYPCAKSVFSLFGIARGTLALVLLGKLCLGALVAMGYLIFRQMLAILIRMAETDWLWTRILARVTCGVGAVLFLCADPVWTLGYYFSPALMEVLLFTLTLLLLTTFLSAGSVLPAYFAMFLLGLLGAETPLGLISLAGFWLIYYIMMRKGGLMHVKLLEPLMQQYSKWYLTFFWAVGLLVGVAINITSFKSMGGMQAMDLSVGAIPLRYVSQLWQLFCGAAREGAWIVGVSGTALSFILSVAMLRRATDLEYFLNYHVGIVFFVVGCLTYSQMSALHPLWFWTLGDVFTVPSRLLLFLCALMCAMSVLCALAVTVVDAFCRDHRRLAGQFSPELDEPAPDKAGKKGYVLPTVGFAVVCALLLAGVFTGRGQRRTKEMLALIDDYVREVVTEAGDAKFIFTDGHSDCGIELESARRGGTLRCIATQPSPSARKGYALISLMDDEEDQLSATVGGANILRTWQRDKPGRLEDCALQVGLELWRQRAAKSEYPNVSGAVAKTVWPDRDEILGGTYRSLGLAERILRFYQEVGELPKVAGQSVRDLFLFMQWRLARLAGIRAEIAGFSRQLGEANDEAALAEALDDKNESLKRILQNMAQMREHTMRQMTPREGLRFALFRADFSLAHRYAEAILDSDPTDPDANFGVGMDYLMQEQYNRAEPHLLTCLERRPHEPAIWNNLAVMQYRQGRFDEALVNVRRALELAPRSAEIKDTLVKIKHGMDKDYQPDADEELRIDVAKETDRAKGKLRDIKLTLYPGYNPDEDLELRNADLAEVAKLLGQVARSAAEARASAQAVLDAAAAQAAFEAQQAKEKAAAGEEDGKKGE